MLAQFLEKESQQVKEEITCSICGDLFADPKNIPCLHTFCKRCIERSIESNKKMAVIVCCPLCRAPLPQDGMASIPTSFTISRFVETFRKHQTESAEEISETECSNCEPNGLPAVMWCMNCTESLCCNCNETHKNLKGLKSHKTIPIVLWNQSSKHTKGDTQVEKEFCLYHTDRTLD